MTHTLCSRHIWRKHFNFAEIIWKLVVRSFLGIEPIVVSGNCRNVTYPSSFRPVAGLFTYRPSSRPVSKVTHILSYRRNIVKLLSNTYTFENVRGSLFKYIKKMKRRCCVEIEPASVKICLNFYESFELITEQLIFNHPRKNLKG